MDNTDCLPQTGNKVITPTLRQTHALIPRNSLGQEQPTPVTGARRRTGRRRRQRNDKNAAPAMNSLPLQVRRGHAVRHLTPS